MKWISLLMFSVLQSSCLSALFGSGETKSSSYKLRAPGPDWETIDPIDADSAYRHRVEHTVLNVSSYCGDERLRTLKDLATDVLRQLPNATPLAPLAQETLNGYPALIVEAHGTVDTRPLQARFAIIRTPHCVYDVILAGPELLPEGRKAFEQTLQNFHEGP